MSLRSLRTARTCEGGHTVNSFDGDWKTAYLGGQTTAVEAIVVRRRVTPLTREWETRTHRWYATVACSSAVTVLGSACATPHITDAARASGPTSSGSTFTPVASATATPTIGGGRSHPVSSPSSSKRPASGQTVLVGLSSDGRVVVLRVGQRLRVSLAPNWTPPEMSLATSGTGSPPPLRRDSAQGYPMAGTASAEFTATSVGTATISAHTDFSCLHIRPVCALPQRFVRITVQVRPGIR